MKSSAADLTLGELSTSSGRLAENGGAARANDDALSVAEDCCNLVTSRAFNIHEVTVWVLHQALELVLAFFLSG